MEPETEEMTKTELHESILDRIGFGAIEERDYFTRGELLEVRRVIVALSQGEIFSWSDDIRKEAIRRNIRHFLTDADEDPGGEQLRHGEMEAIHEFISKSDVENTYPLCPTCGERVPMDYDGNRDKPWVCGACGTGLLNPAVLDQRITKLFHEPVANIAYSERDGEVNVVFIDDMGETGYHGFSMGGEDGLPNQFIPLIYDGILRNVLASIEHRTVMFWNPENRRIIQHRIRADEFKYRKFKKVA